MAGERPWWIFPSISRSFVDRTLSREETDVFPLLPPRAALLEKRGSASRDGQLPTFVPSDLTAIITATWPGAHQGSLVPIHGIGVGTGGWLEWCMWPKVRKPLSREVSSLRPRAFSISKLFKFGVPGIILRFSCASCICLVLNASKSFSFKSSHGFLILPNTRAA